MRQTRSRTNILQNHNTYANHLSFEATTTSTPPPSGHQQKYPNPSLSYHQYNNKQQHQHKNVTVQDVYASNQMPLSHHQQRVVESQHQLDAVSNYYASLPTQQQNSNQKAESISIQHNQQHPTIDNSTHYGDETNNTTTNPQQKTFLSVAVQQQGINPPQNSIYSNDVGIPSTVKKLLQ